jgi:uncharacterized membrane protein YoaK (UPF0700 family)
MKTTKDLSKKYSDEEKEVEKEFNIWIKLAVPGEILLIFILGLSFGGTMEPVWHSIDMMPPLPVALLIMTVLAFLGIKLIRR